MIDSGLAESVIDPTSPGAGPKIAPPQFSVEIITGLVEEDFLAIRLRFAGRDEIYAQAPKELTDSHFGRTVPENIRDEYAKRWLASPKLRKFFDRLTGPHPQNVQAAAELAARGGR